AAASREGVDVMGPGTPAATRLENAARLPDLVSETVIRAAEEARDVLSAKPEENEEPCPPSLRTALSSRSYGDVTRSSPQSE
ncbi:MarR family transcriptional regulator, partial [Streptomyces griseoincarnatus]